MWLYNISYLQKDGLRVILGPAQGRFMKRTRAEAYEGLLSLLQNNSEERLASVYGAQAIGTFRVDGFDCHDHGDPKGVYVDNGNPYANADAAFDPLIHALAAKGWNRDGAQDTPGAGPMTVEQTGGWIFCLSVPLTRDEHGEIAARVLIGDPRHERTLSCCIDDARTAELWNDDASCNASPEFPVSDVAGFAAWMTEWVGSKGFSPTETGPRPNGGRS